MADTTSTPSDDTVKTDIKAVMDAQPDLSRFGFGVYNQRKKMPQEIKAEFAESRAEMLTDDSLEEFKAARYWLRGFEKRSTINQRGTSYGLKHVAEPEIGYTANGIFIAAAVAEGFKVKRCHEFSPNAYFNIESAVWKNHRKRAA